MRTDPKLDQEVAVLGGLSREELVAAWIKAYDCPPPSGIRNEMLLRAAAWHYQAKRLGGFSAETKRGLKHATRHAEAEITGRLNARARVDAAEERCSVGAAGARTATAEPGDGNRAADLAPIGVSSSPPRLRHSPGPGARLLRDWNGRTHVVDVVEEGFVFEGRTHRSLSAIAKLITGAHWSGPRFFGL